MNGKEKCLLLRYIRQNIAELNGIDYVPKECKHTECSIGTCPLCDDEAVRFMDELRKKEEAGSPIKIGSDCLCIFETLAKENTDEEEIPELLPMGIIAPLEGKICPEPFDDAPFPDSTEE